MQFKEIFRNEKGAVDLGSIMTGIVILGITGGVIAATIFAIIPWMQDRTAKNSLQSMAVAQTGYKHGMGTYGNINDLAREKLIEESYAADPSGDGTIAGNGKLCARVDEAGGYLASSKSSTGKYYNLTNNSPEPVATKERYTCFVEDYTPYNMVFTIDTSLPNCTTYTFPAKKLTGVSVIWGDSKEAVPVTQDFATHTYPEKREYTVKVTGKFTMYGKPDESNMNCITAMKKWENTGTIDARYAFAGTTNLKEVAEIPNTATLIGYMFKNSTFNGDISDWDVSNALNTDYMFQNAANFNGDINKWDVSKVNSMMGMFYGATSFNQPLNSWNTANVSNMQHMFREARSFNQPLASWNTAKVTLMSGMFREADTFNQDINSWNVEAVTSMWCLFYGADEFNKPLDKWKTTNVRDITYLFNGAKKFNQPLNTWNTSNVVSLAYTFMGASAFNQPLNNWDTTQVISLDATFYAATNFDQDISSWKTHNVTLMTNTFREAFAFNQNISGWNTSSVTSMHNTFYFAKAFKQDLSGWSLAGNPTSISFRVGSGMTAAQSPFKV